MMIQLIVMLNYLLMMMVMIRVWFYVIDSHLWRKRSTIAGLNCIKEGEVLSRYHNNWIMSYACHESFAFWSCVVILWSDRTGTHLASYVARGGVRCGFIPSEVWRQKSCIAFICIHRTNCRCCWQSEVVITTLCGCLRGDGIDILQLLISLSWSITLANWDSIKFMISSTCGFNNLSKQFACWDVSSHSYITQYRYLMFFSERVRSSSTLHTSFKDYDI